MLSYNSLSHALSQKTKKEKPKRFCKICGRRIKQKYYQICIYCRQERKRRKRVDREIRRIVKKELESHSN